MAGKVIWPFDRLDFEATVLAVLRSAAFKDNHRADGIGALSVGDIVTFDAIRRRGKIERGLQFFQRHLRFLAVSEPFDALLLQHLFRILLDHLNEAYFFTTLRHRDGDSASSLLTQP